MLFSSEVATYGTCGFIGAWGMLGRFDGCISTLEDVPKIVAIKFTGLPSPSC